MEIMEILKKTNAILNGHFLLSSGLHSDTYIQCAQALKYPEYAEMLGKALSEKFNEKPDYVVSPALGGLIIGYEVARGLKTPFLFTERNKEGVMELRRNFFIEENAKVIIIEDVITTGKSTLEVVKALEKYKPQIIGIGCIVNRSKKKDLNNIKIQSLVEIDAKTYEPDNCPLCKENIPAVKPGSRK
ncbi:orotate phosphoribosyltransferase [Marinitoga sp. 1135]|uniref:Orotate phosphoribosyltransferase n=1 Tax=Marinitoga piezophila (strain DSM 14283 / JCM 11233 / KA3) TaxID=443254 RepID=H2J4G1_MARPK|nr:MULTISPECIES: orotate phosphoribosyltransferase [Marinitoga]AEX84816.1 orotate phosphoribosyltransferase [Marinitoga piezophila KA3]APT75326.1 orotate phosphoribosyltransferase [Marinitoga sp. 1137]NUU95058.1 orotate phosphoribosyltransferase [Marinitoga sp. 1135]